MLQKRDYICKLDLQICNYAGPPGQKEAFVLRDYHGEGGGSMVFSGEILPQKCSIIGTSEATNSFIYKIQNNYIRFIYG